MSMAVILVLWEWGFLPRRLFLEIHTEECVVTNHVCSVCILKKRKKKKLRKKTKKPAGSSTTDECSHKKVCTYSASEQDFVLWQTIRACDQCEMIGNWKIWGWGERGKTWWKGWRRFMHPHLWFSRRCITACIPAPVTDFVRRNTAVLTLCDDCEFSVICWDGFLGTVARDLAGDVLLLVDVQLCLLPGVRGFELWDGRRWVRVAAVSERGHVPAALWRVASWLQRA